MTTDQQAPEFAAVLVQHAKGRAHDDATEKLRQAVEAVKRTGQSAKVTVELSIYPVKNNSSVIRMEDKVIAKIPEDPRSSMWYPDEKGNLYRNDPAQGSFFDADQTAADGKSAAAGRDN